MAFLSTKLPWELAQTRWAGTLNPLLKNPLVNGFMLDPINLTASILTPVNHLLQRMPYGWIIVNNTAEAIIWSPRPFTMTTISLESNADTTVTIYVF